MMSGLLMFLQDGQAVPRNQRNDPRTNKFFRQRLNGGRVFAGKIELSLPERMHRYRRHVTSEMPQALQTFSQSYYPALKEVAKKLHFNGHARNKRIVHIKKRTQTSARPGRDRVRYRQPHVTSRMKGGGVTQPRNGKKNRTRNDF